MLDPANPYVNSAEPHQSRRSGAGGFASSSRICPARSTTFVFTPKQVTNADQYDIRIDHRISDKDSLFGHSALQDVRFLKPAPLGSAGGCCQGFGSNINGLEQSHAAGWTHNFGPALVNEFRFAFLQWNINTTHVDAGQDRSQTLGIPNANRGGRVFFRPVADFYIRIRLRGSMGDSQYVPEIATDNTFSFSDALSWVRGAHTIKFGAD